MVRRTWFQRSKLDHDTLLSGFAFDLNLRRYSPVVVDSEHGAARAKEELTRAESRAAAANSVEDATACSICMIHPKDTVLNCWYVHRVHVCPIYFPKLCSHSRVFTRCMHVFCGDCAAQVEVCPVCQTAITSRNRVYL